MGDDLFEFASMESRYTQQLSSIEKVPLDVNLKDTAEEEVSFTEVEKLSPYYSFSSENQEVNDTYHISKTSPSKEAGIDTRTPENSSRFFSKVKHVHVNEQEFSFRPRCSTDSQVSLMKKRIKCRRNVSNNGKKEEKPIKTISSFMSKSPIALSDSDSNGKSVSPDSKHCKIEECSLISSHLNLDKNQNNLQRKPSPENETGFRPRLYSENCALLIKKRQNLIKKGIFKKEKENGKSYTMLQGTMKKTQAFVVSDLTSKSRQDMNVKILINADKNLPRADSESSISKKCKQRLTGCNVSHDFEISISQFRPRHNSESKVSKIKEDNDKPKSSLVKEMQFLELPKYEHNFNSAFENSGRCSSSPILPPINNSNGGSDSQLSIISFLPTSSKGSATSTESLTKPRFRQRLHSEGNDTKVDQSSDLPLLDTKEPVRPRRNPDEIPLASRDFVQFSEAREELPFRPRLHSDSNHMKTNKSSHLTVDPKEPFRPRRNTDDMLSEKRKMKIKASKSNDDLFYRSGRIAFRKTEMIDMEIVKSKSEKVNCSDKKVGEIHTLRQPKSEFDKSKTKKCKKSSNSKSRRNGKSRMIYDRHPFDEIFIGSTGEPSDLSSTPTEIPTRTPEPDLFKEFSEFDDGFATPCLPPHNNPLYRPRYCWCTRCQIMYNLYKEDDERLEVWGNYPCFKF